jgi:GT2 family glycosyltransferase
LDISIIIVNYRGWKALNECLDSLKVISTSVLSFEVIIIDNHSNDGELVKFKNKFPKFNFIENSGNNGFSNGCNLGANFAKGEFLFFLNPDTTITEDALETLWKAGTQHPEIGILSCLQIDENNKYYNLKNLFPALGRFFGISRSIFKILKADYLQNKFATKDDLFYPDWVTGAVIFMNQSWFDKVNGWNEDYWLYFEDVDICKKVTEKNGKIAVTTKATIFHKHGGASRINIKTKALTKTEVIISKHVYISNHFCFIEKIILHFLLITGTLLEKTLLSIMSLALFFIPKLKVNRLILLKMVSYYFNALLNQTWISPRAMNYKKLLHTIS